MRLIKYLIKEVLYRMRGEYTTEKLIKLGLKVGKNFKRLGGVILDPSHCWLISIGDDVTIAPNVHVLAHEASTFSALGYTKIGRVTIGNNVFIGAESIILPNVTIGDNVIIGAGSIVTKNLDSNGVYVGNPAHYIMNYDDYISYHKSQLSKCPSFDSSYTLRNKNITNFQKDEMILSLQTGIGYVE